MLARAQHVGGTAISSPRPDRASIGVPAAIRPTSEIADIGGRGLHRCLDAGGCGLRLGCGAQRAAGALDEVFGEKPPLRNRGESAGIFRQLDHFQCPGAVLQPVMQVALDQRGDQAMDAGFRLEVERILHLVEPGRHAGLADPLMDYIRVHTVCA